MGERVSLTSVVRVNRPSAASQTYRISTESVAPRVYAGCVTGKGPMDAKVDPEIAAMSTVFDALSELGDAQRKRVIEWVSGRYDIPTKPAKQVKGAVEPEDEDDEADADAEDEGDEGWGHFAELFAAADPKTEAHKLLVSAYWTQVVQGQAPFGSFTLNKDLKDLGHGATHTSMSMDRLIKERPQLVLQIKKAGKTQQARKQYKLTEAGKKFVEQMIATNGS